MPFELAQKYRNSHLVAQPKDLALNPPDSYLFIQDGLIIACGAVYSLCYVFYIARTYRDKVFCGPLEYMYVNKPPLPCPNQNKPPNPTYIIFSTQTEKGNTKIHKAPLIKTPRLTTFPPSPVFQRIAPMAYEFYYAFATTSTTFERNCFLMWYLLDIIFVYIASRAAYPPSQRLGVALRTYIGAALGVAFLHGLCQIWPDERQQVTAYWTGLIIQFPCGWGSLYLLLKRGIKGQSFEIWYVHLFPPLLLSFPFPEKRSVAFHLFFALFSKILPTEYIKLTLLPPFSFFP